MAKKMMCAATVALAGIIASCPAHAAGEECIAALTSAKGISPSAAYRMVATANPQRGEYETTATFQQRLSASGLPALIAVAVPLSPEIGTYDADAGALRFGRVDLQAASDLVELPVSFKYRVSLKQELQKTRTSAVGQNGFGAVARMRKVQSDYYYFDFADRAPEISLAVNADAATAKALRPVLDLVVSGELTFPPLGHSSHYSAATVDEPVELYGDTYFVHARSECIGIRDRRTGKILAAAGTPAAAPP